MRTLSTNTHWLHLTRSSRWQGTSNSLGWQMVPSQCLRPYWAKVNIAFKASVEWNLIMAKAHFHRGYLLRIPFLSYANNLLLRIQAPRRLRNAFSKPSCKVVGADSFFMSYILTSAAENRQRLFDNDVMHSLLTKIDSLNDTERLLFTLFLVKQYGRKFQFLQSEFGHWRKQNICRMNFSHCWHRNYAMK